MSEWRPIETAPKDGRMIQGKEAYVRKWPDSGRTRYRIHETQFLNNEGWVWYSRGEGQLWTPDKWREIK